MGRISAVDIATRYGLDGTWNEFPKWANSSATLRTRPGAHITFCILDHQSLSQG